jgi:glycosyltransferase involved in cell wall biosynthesis/Flp pilus assembly protein TadD
MRVSIMFRPEGEAPERAAGLASALEDAGHFVTRIDLTAESASADSPAEVVHAVGTAASAAARRAAQSWGSALVCEALPGDPEPSGDAAGALREAAAGSQGGTVLGRDRGQAEALRAHLGLPYLPPVIGDLDAAPSRPVLLALYDRLPQLNAVLSAQSGGSPGGTSSRRRELTEPLRRGGLRRPRALVSYLRGRRLRAAGQLPAAADALTRAASGSGGDPLYELFAAKALRESGERAPALQRLDAVAASDETDPRVLGETAVELARLGEIERARELARRLSESSGDSAAALAEAARAHAALGDVEDARRLAIRAGEQARDGSDAQRTAAIALEQAGEPSEALELARRAGARDQERRLTGLLRELEPGWLPGLGPPGADVETSSGRVLALLEVSLDQAPSGYAYRSRDLLAALRTDGFDPSAATRLGFPASRGVRDWSPVESVDGIVHHRFNVPGMRQYSGVPLDERVQENAERVLDLARRVGPAALIAATPDLNGLVALAVRAATGIPVVYDVRGFPEMSWATRPGGSDTELYRLRRVSETACASSADAVITLSETMRGELAGRGIDPARIFVVPQIVDTDRFSPRRRNEELARTYGLEDRVIVGSVTSLTDYEGVDDLLRALAKARAEWPELAALIVGDGPYRPALEELASELGLGGDVVFTGRVDQELVPDHHALLDLFAIPRRDLEVCRAVTPLKPFEALAMGVPLIASDLPALTEIVSASAGGRTVTPESVDDLSTAILELGRDPSARERLGRSGREYVVAGHTPERAAEALRATLEPLVGENGRRDEP